MSLSRNRLKHTLAFKLSRSSCQNVTSQHRVEFLEAKFSRYLYPARVVRNTVVYASEN